MSRPAVLETDPAEWIGNAVEFLTNRTEYGRTVTADDLRRFMPEPHHPNAVGTAFQLASRRNLITKVRPVNSSVRSRHGGGSWAWGAHPDRLRRAA